MFHRPIAACTLAALPCLAFLWGGGEGASPEPATLPGARAEIIAADYASIQEALDALPAEGGVVRLPAGKFEISQPLRLAREDVLLAGAGTATWIHNTSEDGQPALIIQHPDYEKDSKQRLWRIKLADLRLTGNKQSGHGIVASGVNEILLDSITVSEHGGDGIRLDACYEDPRVVDSLITYNKGVGLNLLGCHDIVVAGNQFEENQDALHCTDGFNLCMTGNCLDDHLGDGVVIENTYGSVVSGNMIEECQGTAIILDRDCYGITLSANVIAHNFTGGIDLRDAHGGAVSANTFTIVRQAAIRLSSASGRITITGNNFSDSYIGEGTERRKVNDQEAAGIVVESSPAITITGNVFSGLSSKALTFVGEKPLNMVWRANVLTEVERGDAPAEDGK